MVQRMKFTNHNCWQKCGGGKKEVSVCSVCAYARARLRVCMLMIHALYAFIVQPHQPLFFL